VKRTELKEIRELLIATVAEFGDDGLTSREIVEKFQKKHSREIASVSSALHSIALIKLLADVSNRRPRSVVPAGQGDLFAGYSVPTAVAIPAPGTKEKQRKQTAKLTYRELLAWFKDHSRDRAANERQLAEVRRLLNRVKPFMTSDDMTIEEGLIAAEAADAADAAEAEKRAKRGS
jgi:hypothetical protein